MQLLHATFPDRLPGVGALMLRMMLATMLVWPWALRTAVPGPELLGWAWLAAILLAIGSLLPLGVGLSLLLAWLDAGLDGWPLASLLVCLMLVGPGAYSMDAMLFGRRVLRRPASLRGSRPDTRDGTDPKE